MIKLRKNSFSFLKSKEKKNKNLRMWNFTRNILKRIYLKKQANASPEKRVIEAISSTTVKEEDSMIEKKSLQAVIEEAKKDMLITKYDPEEYVEIQLFKNLDFKPFINADYVQMF